MTTPKESPTRLEDLLAHPEVVYTTYLPGQFLVYEGHVGPGAFIILSGRLEKIFPIEDKTTLRPSEYIDCPPAFLIPPLQDFGSEHSSSLKALSVVKAALLPRSLLQSDPRFKPPAP